MITGIDKIVYGVEAPAECARFFRDWGLAEVEGGAPGTWFETLDGCEIELRPADDAALPPAFEAGSTLRRVVWGVADEQSLSALGERVAGQAEISDDEDGFGCTDPNGLRLSFRVSRRRAVEAKGSPMNTTDTVLRVDRRARVYDRAEPVKIGHVVLFTPDVKAALKFYEDALGFVVSDYYPDAGYFMRCAPEGGHHNLFLLQTPDRKCGLNHVAFTVRDVHEVFGGGLHIARCGWQTQIGPGRHPVSSAYFWYVHNPAGGLAEYYADEDYCTADWKAVAWDRSTETFAEWAIDGGIDGTTRRQAQGAPE
jgi:catechol 2,3-dioxygenase